VLAPEVDRWQAAAEGLATNSAASGALWRSAKYIEVDPGFGTSR
jgi:hypothetical protein